MIIYGQRSVKSGFTLMELLIVIAILGILMAGTYTTWMMQIQKGHDARRKSDLTKIRTVLEHYANDHGCYPDVTDMSSCSSTVFASYDMPTLYCDPESKDPYIYEPVGGDPCKGYYLYTTLRWKSDPDIERIGCNKVTGCVPGRPELNYGLSSGLPVNRY